MTDIPRRPSQARPQHRVRVVLPGPPDEGGEQAVCEQAVCETCEWRGPVRMWNHAEHDAEDHAPGTLADLHGLGGLSTRVRWGHPVEIVAGDDGSETAYCPSCERTVSRPGEDNRRVAMRAYAHVRVTTGAPAAEWVNAQSSLREGRMSEELYDLVAEKRNSWRHAAR